MTGHTLLSTKCMIIVLWFVLLRTFQRYLTMFSVYPMAYLHCRIRIPIRTPNQMATLYYVELFILHGVRFRFPSQLPNTGMGLESRLESESASVNVSKP